MKNQQYTAEESADFNHPNNSGIANPTNYINKEEKIINVC